MTDLGPDQIKQMLGLTRHPTCGFVAETYRSARKIPGAAMPPPYEGDRPWGSALYFLVTPDAQIVLTAFARISSTTITSAIRSRSCSSIPTGPAPWRRSGPISPAGCGPSS